MSIKGEFDRNTLIVGDVNISLTIMNRSSRQKINKETVSLNDTLDQMDLIDIFGAFHLKSAEYTHFPSAHGTFSRIDHMLEHRTSLNKFKKIGITSRIFSDHKAMNLEVNHKKNTEKHTKTWRLNIMLLNNEWVNYEVKEEITLKQMKTRTQQSKICGKQGK